MMTTTSQDTPSTQTSTYTSSVISAASNVCTMTRYVGYRTVHACDAIYSKAPNINNLLPSFQRTRSCGRRAWSTVHRRNIKLESVQHEEALGFPIQCNLRACELGALQSTPKHLPSTTSYHNFREQDFVDEERGRLFTSSTSSLSHFPQHEEALVFPIQQEPQGFTHDVPGTGSQKRTHSPPLIHVFTSSTAHFNQTSSGRWVFQTTCVSESLRSERLLSQHSLAKSIYQYQPHRCGCCFGYSICRPYSGLSSSAMCYRPFLPVLSTPSPPTPLGRTLSPRQSGSIWLMRRLLGWQTMSGLLLSQDQRALVARQYMNLTSADIRSRWQHVINHWNAQEFNEDMVDKHLKQAFGIYTRLRDHQSEHLEARNRRTSNGASMIALFSVFC